MECLYCKKKFVPNKFQPYQKYCSYKCNKTNYKLTHKKEKALADKLYNLTHKKEISKKGKLWRQNNKQHKYEMDKAYRLNNPEKHNFHNRLWRKRHPDENRQTQKNYYHKCKKFDINFKIAHNKRGLIREALKGNRISKEAVRLLGCSISDYWIYLESKFINDMTRKNYGIYWNIDHIIPCSSFNLQNKKELLKCFYYKNSQPLTVEANLKKGSKF